ncbi:MAG: O-antigen ligase family protein [Candidatus Woesebacteria bacterium]|nr:MAG: O-antigen ligase family protein [Candidatus Woesebacteria bacterium]
MFTKTLFLAEKILAILTVFLLPTQLALHFWPSYAFVFGIRVDYLSPSIYLTDILVFCLVFFWFINDRINFINFFKHYKLKIFLFVLFVFFNLFFSTFFWISFWKWAKVIEMVLFSLYIYFRKDFVEQKNLLTSLFISAGSFSLIGISQFLLGRTTGLFYFLGERTFNSMTPGIALVEIYGRDFIRIYSTFSHPNSLAGFLGGIILLLLYTKDSLRWKRILIILICFIAFFLTFSLSATMSLFVVILLLKTNPLKKLERKIVLTVCTLSLTLSLLLPLVSRTFYTQFNFMGKKYTERIDLAYVSGSMISSHFFQGVGLNNFIINLPKHNGVFTYQWILQPVHNSFLLIFSETGFIGLAVYFLSFLKLLRTKYFLIFLFILITGMVDHYWLTLQQNLLLSSFLVGLSLKRLKM